MAKEQWHNWGRTVTTIITLVFVCGITYKTIGHNTEDIGKVEVKVDTNTKDIHEIELNAKDIKNVAVQAAESMISIDSKLDAIQKEQANQATIQAVNSTKLESLTKD